MKNKISPSLLIYFLCIIVLVDIYFNLKQYKKNVIIHDIVSYYGYVPAFFLHHDLKLDFRSQRPEFFGDKYWPETGPNNSKVIKTTMGLGFLYCPFFFAGHFAAPFFHYPQDGYSFPYQLCLFFSDLFYFILGFWFFRKSLLKFFPEKTVSLTMIAVFAGTNLYFYLAFDPIMSHGYLFSLTSVFIYSTIRWYENTKLKWLLLLAFFGGLTTLIRPTNIVIMLFPLLYGIVDRKSFNERLKLLYNKWYQVLPAALVFFIPIIPQLIYWKFVTGNWLYYSYTNERFYFNHPHIVEGLFGYRKGWFVYTPMMLFAALGFFFVKNYAKDMFVPALILFLLTIYILLSWWSWWYGGGFGLRAFIDYYPIFAFPMASAFSKLTVKGYNLFFYPVFIFIVALNCFQSYQYIKGFLHYDGMTKKAYWSNFGKLDYAPGWWDQLKQPDYDKARQGLSAD